MRRVKLEIEVSYVQLSDVEAIDQVIKFFQDLRKGAREGLHDKEDGFLHFEDSEGNIRGFIAMDAHITELVPERRI